MSGQYNEFRFEAKLARLYLVAENRTVARTIRPDNNINNCERNQNDNVVSHFLTSMVTSACYTSYPWTIECPDFTGMYLSVRYSDKRREALSRLESAQIAVCQVIIIKELYFMNSPMPGWSGNMLALKITNL